MRDDLYADINSINYASTPASREEREKRGASVKIIRGFDKNLTAVVGKTHSTEKRGTLTCERGNVRVKSARARAGRKNG